MRMRRQIANSLGSTQLDWKATAEATGVWGASKSVPEVIFIEARWNSHGQYNNSRKSRKSGPMIGARMIVARVQKRPCASVAGGSVASERWVTQAQRTAGVAASSV
jgi:hypothetical protein